MNKPIELLSEVLDRDGRVEIQFRRRDHDVAICISDGTHGASLFVRTADLLTIARAREEAHAAIYEGSAEIITVRRKEINI